MPRHFQKNATEFFTVVGAPCIRENHGPVAFVRERRTDDQRPRKLEIGAATLFAAFCVFSFAVSIFTTSSAASLVEVAYRVVK
jgi:hypothetical protein